MKIRFLGANRQVTGSRYLLEAADLRLLVDCGMFQERQHVSRNWEPCPQPASSIDYLLLTHAHLDHSGLIPRLVSEGFDAPILSTPATRDLAEIIMSDSAKIQAEDVKFKKKRHERENRRGSHPDVPLYSTQDAQDAVALFKDVPYDEPQRLNDRVTVTYRDAGHILGSAMLEITVREHDHSSTIVFSGDVGQWDKPIIRDPTCPARADYVIMESTYGDRDHDRTGAIQDQLADVVNATVDAGGNIVIPTFAVERAQELMYHLARLVSEDRIPNLLAFLDSPMAVDVTEVFRRHRQYMDDDARTVLERGERLFQFPGLKLVRTGAESKAINRIRGSCIILAGSGMCTAGRIKHHLVRNISRPESTILFVGYQAEGTLGREIVEGNSEVRILGARHEVKARVAQVQGCSAHADRSGLLKWVGNLAAAPKRVFLTHGEEKPALALAEQVHAKLGCPIEVPRYKSEYQLA